MALSAANKAISIPTQHYVGFAKREEGEIPLGFMTPDGTDAAATKRKATVDNWAGTTTANQIDAMSFENTALTGFKLGRNIRHGGYGWGQGNVKWRIEDPRGFELEISSPNLAQIMTCTVIENGEILEACVWGRLGSENVLLPVSSDVYKAATANTERMNTKASLKDLKVGDHVTMQNGDEGEYMGSFFIIEVERYGESRQTMFGTKKKFIIRRETEEGTTYFQAIGSPKLAVITPRDAKTLAENEQIINEMLRSGTSFSSSSHHRAIAVSEHPVYGADPAYELRSFAALQEAIDAGNDQYSYDVFGSHDGKFGQYYRNGGGFHRSGQVPSYHFVAIHKEMLVSKQKVVQIPGTKPSNFFYGRRESESYDVPQTAAIEWHRLFMNFETKNGTKVEHVF